MKIAHVVCTFPPYHGGMGNVAYHFARLNALAGHQVTVFTPLYRELKRLKTEADVPGGMTISRLRPMSRFGHGALIPQLLWKLIPFDRIMVHYPFFGGAEIVYLLALFRKRYRSRLIVHYHMDVQGLSRAGRCLSLPGRLITSSLLKMAHCVTCASTDYIRHSRIAPFYRENGDKFIEIPFGVDTDRFHPGPGNGTEENTKDKIILFVGGLDRAHYFKGVDVLIRAVASLPDHIGKWRLHIVGDGDLRTEYENLAGRMGISESVNFLGSVPEASLPMVYRKADIFVLPSINRNEGFGLVLLEAMASGVPVIASRLPGVRRIFQDNHEGLYVKPGSVVQLKLKMAKLLREDHARIQMGLRARRLVENKYSWKEAGRRLERLFGAGYR